MDDITQTKQTASQEWSKNWMIVLASFVGIGLCLSPLPYYAAITIGPEFVNAFGWDRVTIQSGFVFMTAGVLIGAPLAGNLTDRFGSRRVLLPSIIALGILTASFGLMNAKPLMFFAIFYATAVLGAGTLPMTWSKAIVNNFDKNRGLALGIALTGTGVYGFLAPPFIRSIIDNADWRMAYFCVGALPILLSFPLAFFIFRDRKEEAALSRRESVKSMELKDWRIPVALILGFFFLIVTALKYAGVVNTALLMFVLLLGLIGWEIHKEKSETPVDLPGLTVAESIRDYRFWVILFSFLILGACVSGIIANTIFILLDKGYTPQLASSRIAGLGLIGFSVIVGRLIGGFVVDYIWAPLVAFIFMGIPAVGCYIFMQDMSQAHNSLAIILVGVAAGVEFDLMAFLVSRYLGMKSYGRIYSFIYAAFGLGSGTAPAIFNAIKGEATNYNTVLTYAIFGFLFGAAILLTLGKYRDFGETHHKDIA